MTADGHDCREKELNVLLVISLGLVAILLGIILGIYLTPRALPNWAENVLVSIGTAGALKLGDCLSTLVALSSGRQQSRATELVAQSAPPIAVEPQKGTAAEGAAEAAAAAQDVADEKLNGDPDADPATPKV